MRCPVDNETLVMADRNGVEIDYCPKCRGVWLDRGELDKIIERAAAAEAAVAQKDPVKDPARTAAQAYAEPRREDRRARDYDDEDYDRRPRKRRESFLSDLFDF